MLGWGGQDVNVPCTCPHVGCYARCWVGVGGMLTFLGPGKLATLEFRKLCLQLSSPLLLLLQLTSMFENFWKEIQEIIASSVPIFSEKQSRYKFGGRPRHLSLSLQPHVPKSGPQRGHLLLRCSNFWKRGSDDRPLSWFQYPFP